MNDVSKTLVWIGGIKWRSNSFIVEAELFRDYYGWYINEIRKLYWEDGSAKLDKNVIDLLVDTLDENSYSSLTAAIVAAYLETLGGV